MANPPPRRSGARIDPDFLAYRHLCIVLVVPGFSAGERTAVAAAVVAEAAAFQAFGIELEGVESPTASGSDWAGLCFAADAGRDVEATLVAVYSRRAGRIMLDLHRGAHSLIDREPDPGASAAELVGGLLRALRDFLEHPKRP